MNLSKSRTGTGVRIDDRTTTGVVKIPYRGSFKSFEASQIIRKGSSEINIIYTLRHSTYIVTEQ